MIKYIFTALFVLSTGLTFYLATKLYLGTRGSRLYSSSALVGLTGGIYSVLNIILLYTQSNALSYIANLNFALIALFTYFLWRTTYNQISKNSYHVFIIAFILIQILSDAIVFMMPEPSLSFFATISKYNIMSLVILAFVSIQYFRFSKMNNTTSLNAVPFLLLIYTMSQLASLLTIDVMSYIFVLIMNLSMLMIMYFYTEDYKRSFYY